MLPDFPGYLGLREINLAQEMDGHKEFDSSLLASFSQIERVRVHAAELRVFSKNPGWSATVMDEAAHTTRFLEQRRVERCITGKNDVLFFSFPIKMVGQRRRMVGNAKRPDRPGSTQPIFPSRMERPQFDPHPHPLLPEPEDIEEATSQVDRSRRAIDADFSILEHQAVDEGWPAIHVVGVDVGQEHGPNLTGVNLELQEFLDNAPWTINEDNGFLISEEKRSIVPLLSGDRAACSEKSDLGHRFSANDTYRKSAKKSNASPSRKCRGQNSTGPLFDYSRTMPTIMCSSCRASLAS